MKYSFIRIIGECSSKPFNFTLKSHITETVTGMILQKNVLVVCYMTLNIGHIHQKQANILNQISVLTVLKPEPKFKTLPCESFQMRLKLSYILNIWRRFTVFLHLNF